MNRHSLYLLILSLATCLLLLACGSDSDKPSYSDGDEPVYQHDGDEYDSDGDSEEPPLADGDGIEEVTEDGDLPDGDVELICGAAPAPPYCPDNVCYNDMDPGWHLEVILGNITMMGQAIEMGLGMVYLASREEFGATAQSNIPLDTCVLDLAPEELEPECATDADCFPEQNCLPEKDDNGSPIPNSERCVTQFELMDVGPFTISGFTGGSKTFAYNTAQSGAYTENGQGDGTFQTPSIAFDTNYEIQGEGDAAQGLGPFEASFDAPAQIELTQPQTIIDPNFGMEFLPINQRQPLDLRWTGSGNPDNSFIINVSASALDGSSDGSFTCRIADDGEFTIPALKFAEINLSVNTIANFMIEQNVEGFICGQGISYGKVTFQQLMTVFIQASQ